MGNVNYACKGNQTLLFVCPLHNVSGRRREEVFGQAVYVASQGRGMTHALVLTGTAYKDRSVAKLP